MGRGIDVDSTLDQRLNGSHVSFASGEKQSAHASHEVGSDLAGSSCRSVTGAGFRGSEPYLRL